MIRRLFILFAVLTVLVMAAAGGGLFWLKSAYTKPSQSQTEKVIVIERGIKRSRGLQQMTDNCLLFFPAHQALLDRHMCSQSCKDSQLTTEGFRRCDTNFRSGQSP